MAEPDKRGVQKTFLNAQHKRFVGDRPRLAMTSIPGVGMTNTENTYRGHLLIRNILNGATFEAQDPPGDFIIVGSSKERVKAASSQGQKILNGFLSGKNWID